MMMTEHLPDAGQSVPWVIIGVFSAWGGVVRYLMDLRDSGTRWRWTAMASRVVISGFTGFLGGLYGYEQHYGPLTALVMAGVSSTLGGSLLRWLWRRVLQGQEESARPSARTPKGGREP